MSRAEAERQWERIMRAPLVVRDREYPFFEDVIVHKTGAVDPNLGSMAKVSSLIEVLRLGGNYELVYQVPGLGAVYSACCPNERRCYVVKRRGLG